MVSESELVNRLRQILQSSDLNTTTAGAVRRQLEHDFSVDLSDRKKFITDQIDEFLQASGVGDASGADDGNVDHPEERESADDDDNTGDGDGDEEEQKEDDDEEEEEGESDDKGRKKKRSKDEETNKKKGVPGFAKLCSISPQLQELVGVSEMARTEVVKKLWAYIKENNLQDPKNKRNINCDKKLHSIFRVDCINMFQMNKVLSKHIWPLGAEEELARSSPPLGKKRSPPPEKKQKRQKEEDVEDSKQKSKQRKGGTTGFLKPLQLSEAFANFLGTGETTLSRAETVKRTWDYIKKNDLQDPSDKRRILCDEKLKELFEVDSFTGFSVTKLLTAHLTKIEQ